LGAVPEGLGVTDRVQCGRVSLHLTPEAYAMLASVVDHKVVSWYIYWVAAIAPQAGPFPPPT
jgi:hypothetical protein